MFAPLLNVGRWMLDVGCFRGSGAGPGCTAVELREFLCETRRGEEGRVNPADSPHPSPLPVRRGEGEGTSHSLSFLNSTAVHLGHLPSKGRGRCQVRLSHIVRIRRCPCWRRNSGPEARLTGRPEVCPTLRHEQLPFGITGTYGHACVMPARSLRDGLYCSAHVSLVFRLYSACTSALSAAWTTTETPARSGIESAAVADRMIALPLVRWSGPRNKYVRATRTSARQRRSLVW